MTGSPAVSMNIRMRRLLGALWVVASVVLGWHGMGSPVELGDERCDCQGAGSLQASDASEAGAMGGEEHESCPPDCDDCMCCGSPAMIVADLGVALAPIGTSSLPRRFDGASDAPIGDVSGVFRPPRA